MAFMAPEVGLEPTTLRLTAECSAIELLRSVGMRRPATTEQVPTDRGIMRLRELTSTPDQISGAVSTEQ